MQAGTTPLVLYKLHFFNAKKSCDIRNMRKMADKAPRLLCQFLKIKLPDRLTKVLCHVSKF